ncbi:MAG: hypothetical protein ACQERF_09005 [Actinomycetota bacterium]
MRVLARRRRGTSRLACRSLLQPIEDEVEPDIEGLPEALPGLQHVVRGDLGEVREAVRRQCGDELLLAGVAPRLAARLAGTGYLLIFGLAVFANFRFLGILLVIAGLAHVADTLAQTVLPDYQAVAPVFLAIVAVPSMVGEGWPGRWLLRTRCLGR